MDDDECKLQADGWESRPEENELETDEFELRSDGHRREWTAWLCEFDEEVSIGSQLTSPLFGPISAILKPHG